MDHTQVTIGAPVFTQDGEEVGSVKEVRGRYFKVDVPMAPDYWLPLDAVRGNESGRVTLSANRDRLDGMKVGDPGDDMGGDDRATVGATTGTTTGTTTTRGTARQGASASSGERRSFDDARDTFRQNFTQRHGSSGARWDDAEPAYRYGYDLGGDERYQGREWNEVESDARTGYSTWARQQGHTHDEGNWDRARDYARDAFENRRLELREERLRPVTEQVEAGSVGLRKEVVTEQQTVEVPITREEVYVERRDVGERPASGAIGEDGETIEVPVREERARLEKETVVTGEVEIGKRAVQETEQVTGEVRREEARLVRNGDVDVREGDVQGHTTQTTTRTTGTTGATDTTGTTRRTEDTTGYTTTTGTTGTTGTTDTTGTTGTTGTTDHTHGRTT